MKSSSISGGLELISKGLTKASLEKPKHNYFETRENIGKQRSGCILGHPNQGPFRRAADLRRAGSAQKKLRQYCLPAQAVRMSLSPRSIWRTTNTFFQ